MMPQVWPCDRVSVETGVLTNQFLNHLVNCGFLLSVQFLFWSKTRMLVHSYAAVFRHFWTLEDTLVGFLFNDLIWCGQEEDSGWLIFICNKKEFLKRIMNTVPYNFDKIPSQPNLEHQCILLRFYRISWHNNVHIWAMKRKGCMFFRYFRNENLKTVDLFLPHRHLKTAISLWSFSCWKLSHFLCTL